MYKNILVPIDISDTGFSRHSIDKAVAFASATAGAVRLIYVRSILPVTFMEFVPPDFDTEQQESAEADLAALAKSIVAPEISVSHVVRLGSIYNEVLQEAEEMKADLIIVGSHKPGMSTYLIGSNAATIVRHAGCSVLVVRE
ncbi:universal stress protein [Chelatococcus asaccharovorans]|uniref:Universal stress protein n=1 Tax=Chelatococcus asaccharovorans TaxID=28210 RepID=A0A2V3TWR0_9HYPH|nr:universal stress protein [Chelatococcus asaccharovorans]MBS7704197.1 universal stress protein [Chelatococcus asaccharovorans]PXW53175.1 nucleotide-binding universal stress UspA family protein [Chelatococcus asaccharovorans]CAH1665548.1 Universal stress protein [Chelatococcus asaccharovorans]CAH1681901.1 Universal stress protein [Chelatococcus asaccharovorans]